MHISCLSWSATLPFPENFSIASWLTAFPESAGKSYCDTCVESTSLAGHRAHPGPSAPIDSMLYNLLQVHQFSYSLPSFPILLLFNKAGHCSGNLWLQLPGYQCRQTGKQNSCSQRAAERSVLKAGKEKKKSRKWKSLMLWNWNPGGREPQPTNVHATLGENPKCFTNKKGRLSFFYH